MTWLAAVVMLALGSEAQACIWRTGTDHEGGTKRYSPWDFPFDDSIDIGYWEREVRLHGLAPASTHTIDKRIDHAVALMYLGRHEEAIAELEGVEKAEPNRYETASNLGTAYELAGKTELALKWIREGLKRNPDSHFGTEWLHVRILEAKLAAAKDPDWFENNSILDLDFGAAAKPRDPGPLERDYAPDLDSWMYAITYQLRERVKFVKAPNAVVANLAFDFANLGALYHALEESLPVYQRAQIYGYPDGALLNERMTWANSLVLKRRIKDGIQYGLVLLALGGLLAGVLVLQRRRARKAKP